jgi:glutathione transport system permease protein
MMVAVTGVSLPAVWIGPLLIYLFTVKVPLLPPPGALAQDWRSLILPSITLGLALSAMLARMTRGQLVRVLSEDYIRTARAKGLSTFRVVVVHGLRNALIPVATVAGMQSRRSTPVPGLARCCCGRSPSVITRSCRARCLSWRRWW